MLKRLFTFKLNFLILFGVFFCLTLSFLFFTNNVFAADCQDTEVTVIIRNSLGEFVPDMSFALYTQVTDVDGKPKPGVQAAAGKINPLVGSGYVKFNVEKTAGNFALKVWQINKDVGEFWFYNDLYLECGSIVTITENVSGIHFVLRDPDGELVKNKKFRIYTQRKDADGNPIKEKEDYLGEFDSSEEGEITLYVSDSIRSLEGNGNDYYIFESAVTGGNFIKWGIKVNYNQTTEVTYTFSDVILKLQDASGLKIIDSEVNLYEQEKNLNNEYILGKSLQTSKTDINGLTSFIFSEGTYAVTFKDSLGQAVTFWNIKINDQQRTNYTLVSNFTRINFLDVDTSKIEVNIYSMLKDVGGLYYKADLLKNFKANEIGVVDLILNPKPYLFTIEINDVEYGQAMWANNNQSQILTLSVDDKYLIEPQQKFALKPGASGPAQPAVSSLAEKLKGYILLQVQANGEAWYVNFEDKKRYYMKDGDVAYEMLRRFGLGITNADLDKIPIGFDKRFADKDSDGDGLSDKMEDGLGTNRYSNDSDGDGYLDAEEILNNYDPNQGGNKKLPVNLTFANKLKGRILLQVEANGEAWYVNPKDGKRYYMQDGESAYEIMRYLSLGITNIDLSKISEGKL